MSFYGATFFVFVWITVPPAFTDDVRREKCIEIYTLMGHLSHQMSILPCNFVI